MEFNGWQILEKRMRVMGYAEHEIAEAKRNYESAVMILGRVLSRSRVQRTSEDNKSGSMNGGEK